MYIPQDSRNNAVDINSVLSPSAGFALDSSLDAELSLHNVASDSWNNPSAGAIFTNGNPYVYPPPPQQSGSPTSTTVATPTNDFNASITTGSVSQPAISSQPGIFAPTVVLRRPSADTSGIKIEGLPERTLTPSPFDYQSTPSPLRDFGNLDLKSALTIDGPVCLMNGDTVEYVDHLLPVSPGGSSCGGASGLSAPNSPMFDLSPENLDNINTNKNATNSNNDYLQMSNWENSISLSPTSSPPPMGLDLQGQDWLPGANQYQQHQQNLTSFPEPFTSGTSTPMAPFGGETDPTQQEQRQQPPTQRRSAHNAVEKKYRNNINDRIAELKNAVPALRHARVKKDASASHDDNNNEDEDSDEPVFMDGVAVATKLNKATILQKATEYVFHLQHANTELKQDIDALLTTIANNIPNGHELAQQYRQHVHQRDTLQQQQLLYREKMKRHKKSGPAHYQYQHQQQQHHHHSPVKGENRSLNQQHPQLLYLQQQQQQQQ